MYEVCDLKNSQNYHEIVHDYQYPYERVSPTLGDSIWIILTFLEFDNQECQYTNVDKGI